MKIFLGECPQTPSCGELATVIKYHILTSLPYKTSPCISWKVNYGRFCCILIYSYGYYCSLAQP